MNLIQHFKDKKRLRKSLASKIEMEKQKTEKEMLEKFRGEQDDLINHIHKLESGLSELNQSSSDEIRKKETELRKVYDSSIKKITTNNILQNEILVKENQNKMKKQQKNFDTKCKACNSTMEKKWKHVNKLQKDLMQKHEDFDKTYMELIKRVSVISKKHSYILQHLADASLWGELLEEVKIIADLKYKENHKLLIENESK